MILKIRLLLIALAEWILVAETESASYTRNYDGYLFTTAGLSVYRNKDEAQRLCRLNGSNLLEINSIHDENLMLRFLSDIEVLFKDGTVLFTNGIINECNWNWVNGQSINSVTVVDQKQGLPYSFGYINLNPSGLSIAASTPIENRGYICQATGNFTCTNGFQRNEVCYKNYSSPKLSWFDARNRCLGEGGDLASFDFINDNQELNSTLNGPWINTQSTYWIGIRRQWWTWQTSNLEVRYSNWQNGRPLYSSVDRCLCLQKNGAGWKWIECNCNYVYPFICFTVLPTTLRPSSTTTKVTSRAAASDDKTSSGFTNITATHWNSLTSEPNTLSSGSDANNDMLKLGIGIGVGIGGILMIAAIVIVFIFVRKRGCPRKLSVSNPPDVIRQPVESHYVEIRKLPGNESSSTPYSNQSTPPPPPVYADLDILTQPYSPSMEQDTIFLISSKTATLAPPTARKETVHVTLGGQEYAEIRRT